MSFGCISCHLPLGPSVVWNYRKNELVFGTSVQDMPSMFIGFAHLERHWAVRVRAFVIPQCISEIHLYDLVGLLVVAKLPSSVIEPQQHPSSLSPSNSSPFLLLLLFLPDLEPFPPIISTKSYCPFPFFFSSFSISLILFFSSVSNFR